MSPDNEFRYYELAEERPKPSNLTQCAAEYKRLRRGYTNSNFAAGWCDYASNEFMRLLLSYGVITPEMVESGEARTHTYKYGDGVHADFRLGRIVVDWTARQFDPNAPFPLVYRLGDDYQSVEAQQAKELEGKPYFTIYKLITKS